MRRRLTPEREAMGPALPVLRRRIRGKRSFLGYLATQTRAVRPARDERTSAMNDATATEPGPYLDRLIAIFNESVSARDFSRFVDEFCDDAVLEFDGIPDPAVEGKAAIAARYRDDPPDDQIRVTRWKAERERITAEFRWRDIPEATGGCVIIDRRGEKIAHLTLAFGGPAIHCFG